MSAEAAGCPRTACVVVGVDRGGAGAIGTGRGGSDATTDASKSSVGTTPAAHSSRQAYIFAATGLFRTAERLRSSASFNATYSVSTASRPLTPAGMRFFERRQEHVRVLSELVHGLRERGGGEGTRATAGEVRSAGRV